MKIAVVGTGSAGLRHLKILRSLEMVDPIAVPFRPSRLAELEAEGYETAPDIRTAVSQGATAAIVASDTGKHVDDSLSLLEEGLDILVEKPMALDSKGAQQMCSRALELGRTVYVGCVLRFSESLTTFRKSLEKVGQLHSARIECQSYLPEWRPSRPYRESYSSRLSEGGVLRDLIHEIDYAGWIFGWPHAIEAKLINTGRLGIEAEEMAALIWKSPSGCLVSINLDYLSKPARRLMTAYGEYGTITWDGIDGIVTLLNADAPMEETKNPQTGDQLFLSQAYSFVTALLGTCDPRMASGPEGVKALAICDAARRASDSRREETVPYS